MKQLVTFITAVTLVIGMNVVLAELKESVNKNDNKTALDLSHCYPESKNSNTCSTKAPNIEGQWMVDKEVIFEQHMGSSGLPKTMKFIHVPYFIRQFGAFFTLKNSDMRFHSPKTTRDNMEETLYCMFEYNNTHFVCTDADEPGYIKGEVRGKRIYYTYVESGNKNKSSLNPFAIGRSIMYRAK